MMTASSIDLFPCRVHPIRYAAPTTTTGAAATVPTPRLERSRRVSRNLFGTPEPGEITNMLQEDTKQKILYVHQRYGINIASLQTSCLNCPMPAPTSSQPPQMPTFNAQELQQLEKRLQNEEPKSNGAPSCEITPHNAKICQQGSAAACKILLRRSRDDGQSSTAVVRQKKPYARQALVTECFNLRKNNVCLASASQAAASAETLSLHNNPIDTHRNVQVLNLPQPMQAVSREVMTTNDITEEDDAAGHSAKEDCSTDVPSLASTTLSLKVVVSTKKAT